MPTTRALVLFFGNVLTEASARGNREVTTSRIVDAPELPFVLNIVSKRLRTHFTRRF